MAGTVLRQAVDGARGDVDLVTALGQCARDRQQVAVRAAPIGQAISEMEDPHGQPGPYCTVPAPTPAAPLDETFAPDFSRPLRSWSKKRRIVFTSTRTGESEIFAMNEDGSEAVDLTNNPASGDSWPAASRDGRKIAFSRGAGLAREIYVMNADGTGQRRITTNASARSDRPGRPTAGRSRSSASVRPTSA